MLNVFVGLVLLFGAALLVVGGSIFSTLDEGLSKSIIGSITGHLQVYGARSKDPLEIYGRVDGSDSSLAPLDDFKGLKAKLLAVPNVAKVVPMGAATSIVGSGNTVDVTLERLRRLINEQTIESSKRPAPDYEHRKQSLISHVRTCRRPRALPRAAQCMAVVLCAGCGITHEASGAVYPKPAPLHVSAGSCARITGQPSPATRE